MLKRDFLLAQLQRLFDAIGIATHLVDGHDVHGASEIVAQYFNEEKILSFLENADQNQLTKEEYDLLVIQAEFLFLKIRILKEKKEIYEKERDTFLALVEKLESTSKDFNYKLHRKYEQVKSEMF